MSLSARSASSTACARSTSTTRARACSFSCLRRVSASSSYSASSPTACSGAGRRAFPSKATSSAISAILNNAHTNVPTPHASHSSMYMRFLPVFLSSVYKVLIPLRLPRPYFTLPRHPRMSRHPFVHTPVAPYACSAPAYSRFVFIAPRRPRRRPSLCCMCVYTSIARFVFYARGAFSSQPGPSLTRIHRVRAYTIFTGRGAVLLDANSWPYLLNFSVVTGPFYLRFECKNDGCGHEV